MKRLFLFVLFLVMWLVPSTAGCAKGGESHTRRPVSGDAGIVAMDAARPFVSHDAGMSAPDARLSAGVPDAARSQPDAAVAVTRPDPVGESHLLRIALSAAVRSQCPAGWRIRLWLTDPPVESTRSLDLELHIPDLMYFGPWSSITLWCDERMPQWYVWDASDRDALGSNVFSELSLDGADLRPSTELCEDPLAPGTGFRPILLWDASRRGTCPP